MKVHLQRYLDDHLANYRRHIDAGDWWYAKRANPSNTAAAGNGSGGIIALALRFSSPLGDPTATTAADKIKRFYRVITADLRAASKATCTGTTAWRRN